MILGILFDIFVWVLGYFALFAGSGLASGMLVTVISVVFVFTLLVDISYGIVAHGLESGWMNKAKMSEFKKAMQTKAFSASNRIKTYSMFTSAAEVAILASFGWTTCAIVWALSYVLLVYARNRAEVIYERLGL